MENYTQTNSSDSVSKPSEISHPEIWKDLEKGLNEIFKHFISYLKSEVNYGKFSIKEFLSNLCFGILSFFLLGGFFLTAVVFFLYGIAMGLGEVLKNPSLGFIITGATFILCMLIFLKLKKKIF